MKKIASAAASLALLMGLTGMAHANLITNGGFEEGQEGNSFITLNSNGDTGSASIPGWTLYGSIDWINNYWQNSEGTHSLDLAGNHQQGLVVSDPFETVAGQRYRVTFDMAGNPDMDYDKTLWSVFLQDPDPDPTHGIHEFTFLQAGHTSSDMGWETFYFDFIAAGPTSQISFQDVTYSQYGEGNAWGAALDNVRVDPVPEPSSFLLLGAGLAGLGMLRRKLRKG